MNKRKLVYFVSKIKSKQTEKFVYQKLCFFFFLKNVFYQCKLLKRALSSKCVLKLWPKYCFLFLWAAFFLFTKRLCYTVFPFGSALIKLMWIYHTHKTKHLFKSETKSKLNEVAYTNCHLMYSFSYVPVDVSNFKCVVD